MVKGRDIIGRAVVGQADGARLAWVRDLIFDHETDEVLALVLNDKDMFGLMQARIVPWAQVRQVGSDTVFVESAASVINLKDDARVRGVTDRQTCLSGTKVITTDGRQIGSLADMCIDETNGHVLGYEISEGFVADTLHGKKFLPQPTEMTLGKDVAVVPPEAANRIS